MGTFCPGRFLWDMPRLEYLNVAELASGINSWLGLVLWLGSVSFSHLSICSRGNVLYPPIQLLALPW